jgi:hypothetical protein
MDYGASQISALSHQSRRVTAECPVAGERCRRGHVLPPSRRSCATPDELAAARTRYNPRRQRGGYIAHCRVTWQSDRLRAVRTRRTRLPAFRVRQFL